MRKRHVFPGGEKKLGRARKGVELWVMAGKSQGTTKAKNSIRGNHVSTDLLGK